MWRALLRFTAALEGKDAVLSSLGDHALHANIFNPTTLYTESMHAITEGMRRFVILLVKCKDLFTTWGTYLT